MRVACLQFDPHLGDVSYNISRAEHIIEDAAAQDLKLDLLILPELAFSGISCLKAMTGWSKIWGLIDVSVFSGYNFPSLSAIEPYLEPTTSGATTTWAASTALRLKCHVSVGYPEITTESSPVRYNSAVLVSPKGEVLVNYRKSFLYYTDETWANEGTEGFFAGDLPELGAVAMGICKTTSLPLSQRGK